jgi:hypothetical protein
LENWRLPSGRCTRSFSIFRREWNKIIKPLERATGFTVTSYDPMISLSKLLKLPNGKTDYQSSVQITITFAQAILDALKRTEENARE